MYHGIVIRCRANVTVDAALDDARNDACNSAGGTGGYRRPKFRRRKKVRARRAKALTPANKKKKQVKLDEKTLTSSASVVFKLPCKRLKQFIVAIAPDLDTLVTTTFGSEILCRILYALCGLRPQTPISSFGAKSFKDVTEQIVVRGNFYRKRNGNDVFDKLIAGFVEDCISEDMDSIVERTTEGGFDPQWLELATVRKKGKQELPHMLQMSQNQPQLALGWEPQSVLDIEFVAIVGLKLVAEHAAGS